MKKGIVITAFRPNENFLDIYKDFPEDVLFIVVDNTPGGGLISLPDQRFVLHQDCINKGIGAALNTGIKIAIENKCISITLFDQDSKITKPSYDALIKALVRNSNSLLFPVCVAPQLVEIDNHMPDAVNNSRGLQVESVKFLATSGITFSANHWSDDLEFTTDFFLDFVDYEWCANIIRHGWHLFKVHYIFLPHQLGEGRRELMGFVFHEPASFRHYFQFRDSLHLVFRSYVPLGLRIRLFAILPIKFLFYPFIFDQSISRIKWMSLGIFDFLRGIKGVGSARSILT